MPEIVSGSGSIGPDRLPLPPDDELTATQLTAVREIAAGPRGALFGPFVPLLRSPELMTRLQHVGAHLRFDSRLPHRVVELSILLVARRWSQGFEWGHHRPLAEQAGIPESVVAAIARDKEPPEMDETLSAVWAFVHELDRTGAVSDAAYARCLALFADVGIVELVATLGYYTTLAMVMNVARTPPLPPDGGIELTDRGTLR